jgi:CO/xanthine dehydrogenase FAD-binding subunit
MVVRRDFFESFFTTALGPDELLTAVTLPALGNRHFGPGGRLLGNKVNR